LTKPVFAAIEPLSRDGAATKETIHAARSAGGLTKKILSLARL
jgi:hypothetical protein